MTAEMSNSKNSLFSIFIQISIARFDFFMKRKEIFEKKILERLAFALKKEYNILYYTRILSP